MAIARVEYLFERYYHKTCTPEEKAELMQYVRDSQYDEVIQSLIDKLYLLEEQDAAPTLHASTKAAIVQSILDGSNYQDAQVKVRRLNWRRIAIAASFLMLFFASIYFWLTKQDNADEPDKSQVTVQDVPPGTNKATLTLADGTIIFLDSAATGSLANQGNIKIIKLDSGQLAYSLSESYEPTAITQYNVITTPRGGQYSIVLPDGSKVWLNAASSLKFPLVFNGNERKVQLEGEGYFEIVKNKEKPFKVNIQSVDVEVLGTHFNITGYKNEPDISTTLLEGSVKVSSGSITKLLKPAQQARLNEQGNIQITSNVDTASTVAWKNGYFNFKGLDIKAVMQQIERWYDVDVQFLNTPTDDKYSGKINRNTNLSEVLELLKLSGVDFTIENKTIKVRSYKN